MKVYVITAGCYSDYHIVAVVEDKIIAEELLKNIDDYDASIETYDTDFVKLDVISGRKPYRVDDKFEAHECDLDYRLDDVINQTIKIDRSGKFYCGFTYASDEKQAIKIVQDNLALEMAKRKQIL